MKVIASKEYMYHGTSSTFLRTILKKGLVFDPKKRVWDEVKDSHLESFNGIYFAHNLMTAYTSASTAVDKFGGQRLVIVAKLETRSSQMVLDEDGLTLMIQGMVSTHNPAASLEDLLYDLQKNHEDEHWINFKKRFKEKIKTMPRNVNALFPLFKKMLHSYHLYYVLQMEKKGYYGSYWDKDKLAELKEKFNDITFLQAKKNYRKTMDKFLKKANFLSNAIEDKQYSHTVRITEPVNFRGKNRIVAIVSFLDHHTIKIHYNKDQLAIKALKKQAKMSLSGDIIEAVNHNRPILKGYYEVPMKITAEEQAFILRHRAVAVTQWNKNDRIVVNLHTKNDPEYYSGKITSIKSGKLFIEFDDGDTYKISEKSKKIFPGNKKKRKSEIPMDKVGQYLAESPSKPSRKVEKTAKRGRLKEGSYRLLPEKPGETYRSGIIRLDGKDWPFLLISDGPDGWGAIEEYRFKEGDIIEKDRGESNIVAERQIDRRGKGRFRYPVARYNFADGSGLLDVFETNDIKETAIVKTGEEDPSVSRKKLSQTRTEVRKARDEYNQTAGDMLRVAVEEGRIYEGMVVGYRVNYTPKTGTITGFNFKTGYVQIVDMFGKKKSIKKFSLPNGGYFPY